MAYIEFTAGSYAGQRRDLNSESITIGRDPEAHILLDDIASSSNHAELRFHEGHWWLLDLGSANGTELNSAPVESAALQPGDVVTVGLTSFIFQNEIADEPATAAPAETAVNTNENELALVEKMKVLTERIRAEVGKVIVGQKDVLDQILMCILANGHALLIGLPGMAKTLTVKTISEVLNLNFKRVQFTPDLMPGDIIGTDVLETNKSTGEKEFRFIKGPIFCNLLLADEINRTPPKTQAALLEAMQEKMVTAGNTSYKLAEPFFVLATQNPVEQEGTYPLPEAQLDRFLLKVIINYAQRDDLAKIIERTTGNVAAEAQTKTVLTAEEIAYAQRLVRFVLVAPHVQDYAVRLVLATHPGGTWGIADLERMILVGSSPRGAQSLIMAAKVRALLAGRCAVSTQDIAALASAALRHRIVRTFEAEAAGMTCDGIIAEIVRLIPAEAQE